MLKIFKNSKGYIQFYMNSHKKTITILSLFIDEDSRHRGYGTILINKVIRFAKKLKYKKIKLDDMSSIHGKNNIYYKCGFRYKNENYGPEMVLKLN